MAARICTNCYTPPLVVRRPIRLVNSSHICSFSARNSTELSTEDRRKLVLEVKEKLEQNYSSLPVGKYGRDDDDMIFWFLKDRKFSVDDATKKLAKAIIWRQEFGVSELTEDSVKNAAETGKAFVHDSFDLNERPVLIVVAAKHFPAMLDPVEDKKLCVFLLEKTLSKLRPGKEQILGIFDLRGFGGDNVDMDFLGFVFDVFYHYYPKRLGQILFVEAPSLFRNIWRVVRPIFKSHAALVRFCSVETLRTEYFTEDTLPMIFKD